MAFVRVTQSARNGFMKPLVVSLVVVALVSSCSAEVSIGGSPDLDSERAARLVNEEFEDSLGFGPLETRCSVPNDLAEGDVFTCTSETADGEVLNWSAVATSDSGADIQSDNLLGAETVEELEGAVIGALAEEGLPVAVGDIECGPGTQILGSENELVCGLTDTGTGDVYDTKITIRDMANLRFDIVVADNPR
jgi:hypothetical protein